MFHPGLEEDTALYCEPSDAVFEAFGQVEREVNDATIKRAEALVSVIVAHLDPMPDDSSELRTVFDAEAGAAPTVVGKVPSFAGETRVDAFGQVREQAPRVSIDDTVVCVTRPSGGVVSVKDVERLLDSLPSPTVGVLSQFMDCTGPQVVTEARRVVTGALFMPKLWALAKAGVVGYDRVSYVARRLSHSGICVPQFDELLTSRRLDVTFKTFRKHVNEIIAMLTTPKSRNEDAVRNRCVRYWDNGDGTSTVTMTGPTLVMHAYFARLSGCARAVKKNDIDPFIATLSDKDREILVPGESGEKAKLRVGDLGDVEIDDDRLMDQLLFDMAVGATPSTEVRAKVVPTGQRKPASVEHDESVDVAAEGVKGLSSVPVFNDKWEANNAQRVYEMELCISMPINEEWLKAQANINVTVPVVHFLKDQMPGLIELDLAANGVKMPGGDGRASGDRPPGGTDPGGEAPGVQQSAGMNTDGKPQGEDPPDRNGLSGATPVGDPPNDSALAGSGPNEGAQTDSAQGGNAPNESVQGAGPPEEDGSHETVTRESDGNMARPVLVRERLNVPAMVNNRTPIDDQTADELISRATWVYRMFTDPDTGVVLQSTPTKYRVTAPLKRVIEARSVMCSVLWCPVPARVCEKDHIEPFNHADPKRGGQTVLENLHPLCKKHHQEKTNRRISIATRDDGGLAVEFPRIGTTLVYPPESRINQEQFEQLVQFFDAGKLDVSRSVGGFLDAEHAKAGVAASKQFVTQEEITKPVETEEVDESADDGVNPGVGRSAEGAERKPAGQSRTPREGKARRDERSVWEYAPVPGELVGDAPPF